MKTGMTFRSDDEYWAWVDQRIRMRERLYKAARYLTVMAACVFTLFAFLWFVASHTPPKKIDPWHTAVQSARMNSPP